jgi:hypothetical protein
MKVATAYCPNSQSEHAVDDLPYMAPLVPALISAYWGLMFIKVISLPAVTMELAGNVTVNRLFPGEPPLRRTVP